VKYVNKKLIAIIVIVIVVIVGVGVWFAMQSTPTIKTVNNSSNNNSNVIKTNSTTHKNTTNTTNTTYITAAKAKELAGQYVGMGVSLEDPKLTTYNGVKVWKVPVVTYTPEKSYQDPIYINAQTGKRVT
jgi:cytoskeletal protein RodZ